MKPSILLLALISAAAMTGCSTAYRTGQTPDDVYYSAAKPEKDNEERDRDEVRNERDNRVDEEYYDDRFLRMKVRNHRQWSNLDDWYYYDKYSSFYSYYYGSYNNPYNSWNYYYNPYCCCHGNYYSYYSNIKLPVAAPVVRRNFNLAGYTNTNYNNNGGSYKAPTIKSTRTYNTTNNNNSNGGILKTIFNKDNSSGGRTYSPSTNSGGGTGNSGSGGSGGGSGPVSRPVRK